MGRTVIKEGIARVVSSLTVTAMRAMEEDARCPEISEEAIVPVTMAR